MIEDAVECGAQQACGVEEPLSSENDLDTDTLEDDFLSIPLFDGTRLKIGDCFTVENVYPFFSEGRENYNARLEWSDEEKMLIYDIYPVSDRVVGSAGGGSAGKDEIDWNKIRRRPDPELNDNL